MKQPLIDALMTPDSRRAFLRALTLPVGASLLGGCGGGGGGGGESEEVDPTDAGPSGGQGGVVTSPPSPPVATPASPSPSPSPSPPVAAPAPPSPPAPAPSPNPVDSGPSPVNAPAPTGPVPGWVASLPLWHWYEIPNTALSSVDPTITPLGITGPSSKIDAWCGAALKRQGSVYMLGAAGGHGDYAGNEVNALALNVDNPRWVELRGPTPNADIINGTQFYLDRRPSSTHTYYASQFIESQNRLMVFASPGVEGAFPAAPSGFGFTGSSRSFSFNVAAGDWDDPDHVARFPGGGDFTAALCVKHPFTDDVYYSRSYGDGWYRWTRASNSWVKLSGTTRAPWYAGAAIDPKRGRMLVVGGYGGSAPAVYTLGGASVQVSFNGPAAAALRLGGYPGAIYDEATDCYLVVYNTGGRIRVLRVQAATWFADDPQPTGVAPMARTNGIHNSAQYVPELKGFVIANDHSGNVLFMRTAA